MQEIYYNMAIISSVLLGIMILLNIFGVDVDEFDVDFGPDFFSINSLIVMSVVTGWIGYIGHGMDMQIWVVHAISWALGLSSYVGSIYILQKMTALEESGTFKMENAVGCTGVVYLGIPEKENGYGQIQATVQGRYMTLNAKTTKEKIETGTPILIYDVKDDFVYVETYNTTEQ